MALCFKHSSNFQTCHAKELAKMAEDFVAWRAASSIFSRHGVFFFFFFSSFSSFLLQPASLLKLFTSSTFDGTILLLFFFFFFLIFFVFLVPFVCASLPCAYRLPGAHPPFSLLQDLRKPFCSYRLPGAYPPFSPFLFPLFPSVPFTCRSLPSFSLAY